MRIVRFQRNGRTGEGILEADIIQLVGLWRDGAPEDLPFLLPGLPPGDLVASGETVALGDVTLAMPLDATRKIICVGMNYRDHTNEIKVDVAENPVLFTRPLDSLVAHGAPLVHPRISETFDFEGEIALVIGREGRHIQAEDALSHVFGYTCFMDGSVRAYQRHSLTAGKNFWRSGAIGPWIKTADGVDPAALALQTRLNGEIVQQGRADDLIFSIPQIIAYCSRFTPLRPGDVIATGTPGGVGSRRTPPLWLRPGDRVEVEVGQVGLLSNVVDDVAGGPADPASAGEHGRV